MTRKDLPPDNGREVSCQLGRAHSPGTESVLVEMLVSLGKGAAQGPPPAICLPGSARRCIASTAAACHEIE